MKKTPYFFLLIGAIFFSINIEAQLLKTIGNKAKQKINQRAEAKTDRAIDKGLDGAEGTIKKEAEGDTKIKEADGTKIKTGTEGNESVKSAEGEKDKGTGLSFNSKYDFVPGEKVMYYEDFSATSVGDFPARWNTNATAEVVTLNNREGKWLKINKQGVWHPEFITSLPENFTLEFDLGVNDKWNSNPFALNLANLKTPDEFTAYYHNVSWRGNHALHLEFKAGVVGSRSAGSSKIVAGNNGNHTINNDVEFTGWNNTDNQFAHISLWRQNQRLRVYLNGEKIWDLPRAFDASAKYNAITIAAEDSYKKDDYFLLGNVRLAIGAPDTRNKLITEGRFVTRGILFDTGSDQIKPESAGALRDIINVLQENSGVKVKIVGHTDSDGDDNSNLALSVKRAQAVKSYLAKAGISESNLTTEGKGESQPADKDMTAEAKANNRRVEFIRL